MKDAANQFLLGFFVLSLIGALGWMTQARRRPQRAVGLMIAFFGMAGLAWFYRAGSQPLAIASGVVVFIGVLIDVVNKAAKPS
ncbi:MAG: hypothetical protein JNJ45_04075 [Chthonomonas sp.]|nr:hypothetical protein [Chthonomonas sp.]